MQLMSSDTFHALKKRLTVLYGADIAGDMVDQIGSLADKYGFSEESRNTDTLWDEKDTVLITYGDSIRNESDKDTLKDLKKFVDNWLQDGFSTIHLLPIFPFTSDAGFSVVDYRQVRTELGDWGDVAAVGQHFKLMFDFVINHCSRASLYFSDFRADRPPYQDFFIYEDPKKDWSQVVRPRSFELLTEIPTHEGTRYVWTTFSADQVDLNYKNPKVLLEIIDILMFYISQGASIIRLDAVAFLWKEAETECIHLPQTHEIIKIFRLLTNAFFPEVVLLTETNVPHEENISYFGEGDEAHMVYQFSLPPLLMHAIHARTTRYLTDWAKLLTPPPDGSTYFNFTASHDGIGVRPLEGLMPDEEITQFLDDMRACGGFVSTRRNQEGQDIPYEINITYFDAFRKSGDRSDPWQVPRFLLSQTVAIAMRGIPGVYINSLLATANDHLKVEVTGATRSINRHQWDYEKLMALLDAPESTTYLILTELLRRLAIRRKQPAFHPDAEQQVLDLGEQIFAFIRKTAEQTIVILFNFTRRPVIAPAAEVEKHLGEDVQNWLDIIHHRIANLDKNGIYLKPYGCYWLVNKAAG